MTASVYAAPTAQQMEDSSPHKSISWSRDVDLLGAIHKNTACLNHVVSPGQLMSTKAEVRL